MRHTSFIRLLLSFLVAFLMVAGFGHAASATAPAGIAIHQHAPGMELSGAHAGHMTHMPAQKQPASSHHHDLAGCACCSMSCCAAVPSSPAFVGAAIARRAVVYAARLASWRGVITPLEPDPPRLSTL